MPPSQLNPAVPPALEAVVLRALAKDPARPLRRRRRVHRRARGRAAGIAAPAAAARRRRRRASCSATGPIVPIPPPAAYAGRRASSRGHGPPEPLRRRRRRRRPGRWWVALLAACSSPARSSPACCSPARKKVDGARRRRRHAGRGRAAAAREGFSTDVTPRSPTKPPRARSSARTRQAGARGQEGLDGRRSTVSAGPGRRRRCPIVDRAGAQRRDARSSRRPASRSDEQRETSDTVPKNHVIAHAARGGQQLDERAATWPLVVSRARQQVAVPDVAGQQRRRRALDARDAGFKVTVDASRRRRRGPGHGARAGRRPAARGRQGRDGHADGRQGAARGRRCPTSIGQSRRRRPAALQQAGFKVETVAAGHDRPDAGRHVHQPGPAGGHRRRRARTVTITVGHVRRPGDAAPRRRRRPTAPTTPDEGRGPRAAAAPPSTTSR